MTSARLMQYDRGVKWSESSVAKVGLVGLALVHWHFASGIASSGLMPLHALAVALVLVLYATSFALLLSALARSDARVASRWVFASFALIVLAFWYRDAERRSSSGPLTTDGHAFMDVAARMLVQGRNPYQESLLEAFRVHELPLSYATPLIDGDVSDRVAYPALSFLALVPFVLLHIPTYVAYAASFIAALGLIVWRAPWWLRAIILVLFLYEETFLGFAFDGVTDGPWMLCVVAALLTWSRPTLPFVLIGLACSYKQHPWFLVPFLIVLLCRDDDVRPWQGRPRRLVVIAAAVFGAINLPFFVIAPRAWLQGVLEPLVAPMITLSEGVTSLAMTGHVVLPRAVMSALFWVVYGFALFAYARHTSALRRWCWVIPGVVLWFSHRALSSYWYFYALPGVAALVCAGWGDEAEPKAVSRASVATTLRLGALTAAGIVAVIAWAAVRAAPFEIEVLGPIETWDRHAVGARVRIVNRLARRARPRFTVQSTGQQPLPWVIEGGKIFLEPGQSDEYVLRAKHIYDEFDVVTGARLAVSDSGDPGVRAFVDLPADPTTRHVDVLPNGRFVFLDQRTATPLGWTFEPSDPAIRFVVATSLKTEERIAFEVGPVAAGGATEAPRVARLFTVLAMPEASFAMNVLVPPGANRSPYAELYGLRLEVSGVRSFVLFGERAAGTLPNGARFVIVDAKRGEWTRVVVSIRDLLAELGATPVRQRFRYGRALDLDMPTTPVDVSLYAQFPPGATGHVAFGSIVPDPRGASPDVMVRRGLEDPAGRDAWHGAWNAEQRNHTKAITLLAAAASSSPTEERLVELGDEQNRAGHPEDARATYARVLANGPSPRASSGTGWALLRMGQAANAIPFFERAAADHRSSESTPPRRGTIDALRGLGAAHGALNACEETRAVARRLFEEAPGAAPLEADPCPRVSP